MIVLVSWADQHVFPTPVHVKMYLKVTVSVEAGFFAGAYLEIV